MRRVRDFDAELKALNEKTRALKAKRIQQLGELVIVTRADVLDAETLGGALLEAAAANPATREGWRRRGVDFFQAPHKVARRRARAKPGGASQGGGGLFSS